MSIDWLILAFPVTGIIALFLARHTGKQMRLRQSRLEEQIRQRDNARVIGQARSMAAMLRWRQC